MAVAHSVAWRNVLRSSSASASQLFLLWTLASCIQVSHSAIHAVDPGDDELPEGFIKKTVDLPLNSKSEQGTIHTGSAASVSVKALIDRPEIVMETADESVKFLNAIATSEDHSVVNGDVSASQRVTFRDLVGGSHYFIYAKLLQNDPLPPVGVDANKSLTTTDSIVLEWFKPFDTRVQGYQILYQRGNVGAITHPADPNVINLFNASTTSFNVTGLDSGTKYSFRMMSFMDNVVSGESHSVLGCTRPLKPSFSVQPLPVKLMLQIQRPSNSTKYYRVQLRNLDVEDALVREITIRNDSLVVNYSISIDYLGATYEVRIAIVACDLLSEEAMHIVHSMPPAVIYSSFPSTIEVTQTSVKFPVQTSWKAKYSFFTRFVFAVDGMPPKYVLRNDEDMHVVEFTGLDPGRKYKILGWTERGDVQSDKRFLMVQLKPNKVTTLNIARITSHSIDTSWEPPGGIVGDYEIGCNNTLPVSTNATPCSFTGLRSSTVYSIYVMARSGRERSAALTKFVKTLDAKK
ncbi:tenascin-N-like isoform X2 [Paramacrobiotus metropolitanus]|uniref:tenascin-N-like isoform X2 n=1 Tax=Paramacrobiotus metropolitanus TaxID=2943436 RepID=UPI002445EB58|nr:tenascin-N-like isoform X2 [Paramacrobiotus metropolitanus]